MRAHTSLTRRGFVRLCTTAIALFGANPALLAQSQPSLRRYQHVALVDSRERPITAASLKLGESYLFHYPYISTPCFLLNLGRAVNGASLETENGSRYQWQGGVGPQRSVVSFSAICAHRMSHPARAVSFINYRHQPTTFQDDHKASAHRGEIIYCCSEKSVYDPTQGARVLGGPAKQPLAAIVLEQDERGALYAIGTTGGEMFERFFERFYFRLAFELRTYDVRRLVVGRAEVTTVAAYCQQQILC